MKKTQPIVLKLFLWCVALMALPAYAQTGGGNTALSLEQAKAHALSHNKDIQSAKLDVAIAKKKVMETTGIGLPQFNITGNYQHLFEVPTIEFTPGEKIPIMEANSTTFDFTVTQLIFSGEYIVGLQASKVYKTITEQALRKNEIDLLKTVEETYHMALVIGENLKIVRENLALSRQTLAEMEAMLKEGLIEDTEVDQIRVNIVSVVNLEASLDGQYKNVLNLLKYQMGMELSQSIELTDSLESIIAFVSPIASDAFVVDKNIDYQMVLNQIEVQKLSLKLEKSTFLPTLSGFYQHTEKVNPPLLDMTPKNIIGAQINIPIFGGTQKLMKVKQASMELEKVRLMQTQLEDGLALQYANQRLNFETAYNKFINQKDNKEVSARIFDKTNVKVKEGISSSLDLTQVQSQYLSAVSNYYAAVLELLNAQGELNKLIAQ